MKTNKEKSQPVLYVKIPKELKEEAQEIASGYGLNLSAFTRLLLSQSVREHATK